LWGGGGGGGLGVGVLNVREGGVNRIRTDLLKTKVTWSESDFNRRLWEFEKGDPYSIPQSLGSEGVSLNGGQSRHRLSTLGWRTKFRGK